ncbi:alpha-2,3-sialyltransferase [Campylobacter jejuni]|uniref:SGNH/GDSL hydrolase family protein n=2 Tax=Campylobacter TaxID=194 RepID=UPI000F80A402|nr:SGNH/GDSL hydrolase family protein [Campylobacter jejuni]RTJ59133.1 alpha-2,3-sialyltransferase [Campylobacter jejuni]
MNKKNVILLGASNSRMPGGIQDGLNQDNINLINLSLGGTSSLHRVYSLKRKENQEVLKKIDLIIIEVNIMDIYMCYELNLKTAINNITYLYDELSAFKTKILVLLLFDFRIAQRKGFIINNFHRYKAKEYGYNVIDVNDVVNKLNLNDFFMKPDWCHMLTSIMYQLGKNIVNNISCFYLPHKNKQFNYQFEIITPDQLELLNGNNPDKKIIKNLMYKEILYKIDKNHILKIPKKYDGFQLIGIHTFNNAKSKITPKNINSNISYNYSSLLFSNSHSKLIKSAFGYNIFLDIKKKFIIDNNTTVSFNENFEYSEISHKVFKYENYINTLDHVNLISLFLIKEDFNTTKNINYSWLHKEVDIDQEYNFNHLMPDLQLIKESIEEYNIKTQLNESCFLQNQTNELYSKISSLEQDNISLKQTLNSLPVKKQHLELANLEQDLVIKKLESKKLAKSLGIKMSIINPKITFIQANSAKARIQNHLSYKLGRALIANSKSLWGYIRMPYVLSYIKDKHKFEQKAYEEKIKENPNLALPPLESYPDYKEALKEKECFTYKLGEEFIKASKNWYGGGYIKFIFKDAPRLKKEFGKKR